MAKEKIKTVAKSLKVIIKWIKMNYVMNYSFPSGITCVNK